MRLDRRRFSSFTVPGGREPALEPAGASLPTLNRRDNAQATTPLAIQRATALEVSAARRS
jgi:hypothetical protein